MKKAILLFGLFLLVVCAINAQTTEEPLTFGAPKTGGSNATFKIPAGAVIYFSSYGRVGVEFSTPIDLTHYNKIGIEFTIPPLESGNEKIKMCWTDGQTNYDDNKVFCTTNNSIYSGTPNQTKTDYFFTRPSTGWAYENKSKKNNVEYVYNLDLTKITEFGIYFGSGSGTTKIRVNKIYLVADEGFEDEEYDELYTLIKSYHVSPYEYSGEFTFIAKQWGDVELLNANLESLSHQSTDDDDCTYNITFTEAPTQPLQLRFQYLDNSDSKWKNCNSYFSIPASSSKTFSQTLPDDYFATHNCERVVLSYVGTVANQTFNIASITRSGRESVTIGSTGYATYTTTKKLEFSRVEGLNTYIITKHNSTTGALTLRKVDIVPAGKPVILITDMYGETTKTFGVPSTTKTADNVSANLLLSAPENGFPVTDDGNTYYALANKAEGVGFYKVKTGVTIPAGKAYLKIEDSDGAREFLGFDNSSTTQIVDITPKAQKDDAVYDLTGRRITQPVKGSLYIQNGKKLLAQ